MKLTFVSLTANELIRLNMTMKPQKTKNTNAIQIAGFSLNLNSDASNSPVIITKVFVNEMQKVWNEFKYLVSLLFSVEVIDFSVTVIG